MNRRLLLPLIFCLGTLCAHADEAAAPSPTPITNPAQVSEHYRQVLQRPEFQDSGETDLSTRFKDWISQWFMRLGARLGQFKYTEEMPGLTSLLMSLMVLFALAALIYIMVRLSRRRGGLETIAKEGAPGQKIFRPPESYDEEIRQAIRIGDWHAAWMAAWRQFLSRLENRQLVEADRTRTNREYLAQLRARTLPASVLALLTGMVDAYDRFIYGRKVIGEPDWNFFYQQINEAALLLHLEDKRPGSRARQPEAGA